MSLDSKCNIMSDQKKIMLPSSGRPNQIPNLFCIIRFGIFWKYQTEYLQAKTEHKKVLSKELEVLEQNKNKNSRFKKLEKIVTKNTIKKGKN